MLVPEGKKRLKNFKSMLFKTNNIYAEKQNAT